MSPEEMQSDAAPKKESVRKRIQAKLREQGLFGAVRHYRVVLFHRVHTMVEAVLNSDGKDADRTTGKVELADVQAVGPNAEFGVHYLPSPWIVLDWVMDCLPTKKESWSFIDLGAGKGRVMLAAGKHPFVRIVGVEFIEELADSARKNIHAAGQLQSNSIEVLHCDASAYEFPKGPVIVFLFNPFHQPVIGNVANSIGQSYDRFPRPMIVAYLNPIHSNVFADLDGFARQALRPTMALKFSLLSPYKLHIYANREGSLLLSNSSDTN